MTFHSIIRDVDRLFNLQWIKLTVASVRRFLVHCIAFRCTISYTSAPLFPVTNIFDSLSLLHYQQCLFAVTLFDRAAVQLAHFRLAAACFLDIFREGRSFFLFFLDRCQKWLKGGSLPARWAVSQ